MSGYEWTPEEIATLTQHVRNGMSGTQIGARMGRSKNSVVGMAKRQGLRLTGARTNVKGPAVIATKRPSPQTRKAAASAVITTQPDPVPSAPVPRQRAFTHSSPGCQWITGDVRKPGWTFCGDTTVTGRSWCEHHLGRVFDKSPAPAKPLSENAPARFGINDRWV